MLELTISLQRKHTSFMLLATQRRAIDFVSQFDSWAAD